MKVRKPQSLLPEKQIQTSFISNEPIKNEDQKMKMINPVKQ